MTEQEWREKFAASLEYEIRRQGCTLREFAEEADISETALSNYLRGKRLPNVYVLRNMAKTLDCSTDDLIGF